MTTPCQLCHKPIRRTSYTGSVCKRLFCRKCLLPHLSCCTKHRCRVTENPPLGLDGALHLRVGPGAACAQYHPSIKLVDLVDQTTCKRCHHSIIVNLNDHTDWRLKNWVKEQERLAQLSGPVNPGGNPAA